MKTTTVGNGTAVHAYTSWTGVNGFLNENTECGAVEVGGNALYGHRTKVLYILSGEREVTCKRCLRVLARKAHHAALVAPVASTSMSMEEYAAQQEARAAAAAEDAATTITEETPIVTFHSVDHFSAGVGNALHALEDAEARMASMANHPAGKARQAADEDDTDGDPTVITTRDAIATAESWALATGSLAVIVKIDQVDADGSTHGQVAGTYRRTPKGAHVGEIVSFDRSTKAVFHCENHPADVWYSKDPFSSHWFPETESRIQPCDCPVNAYVLWQDYIYRG